MVTIISMDVSDQALQICEISYWPCSLLSFFVDLSFHMNEPNILLYYLVCAELLVINVDLDF